MFGFFRSGWLLGIAAVSYFAIIGLSAGQLREPSSQWCLLLSVVTAFMLAWIPRAEHTRVWWLGLFSAVAMMLAALQNLLALPIEVATPVAVVPVGVITLDLAWRFERVESRLAMLAVYLVGAIAMITTVGHVLSPLPWFPYSYHLFSTKAALAPWVTTFAFFVGADLSQLWRMRWGTGAQMLAGSFLVVLGTSVALLLMTVAASLSAFGVYNAERLSPALIACALFSNFLGIWLSCKRAFLAQSRVIAQGFTAFLVALLIVIPLVYVGSTYISSRDYVVLLSLVAAAAIVALHHMVYQKVAPLFFPFSGRLLAAIEELQLTLQKTGNFEDFVSITLTRLRTASKSKSAEPYLFLFDPDRAYTLDAAGLIQRIDEVGSAYVKDYVAGNPTSIVERSQVQSLEVRRPDLRPLIDTLVKLDALCLLPLCCDTEVEGALVVPSGSRTERLSFEELEKLDQLRIVVACKAKIFNEVARANTRATSRGRDAEKYADELLAAKQHADQLAEQADAIAKASSYHLQGKGFVVASLASQNLVRQIKSAPPQVPLLLQSPCVASAVRLAAFRHKKQAQGSQFVVLNAAALAEKQAAELLFGAEGCQGSAGQAGWLELGPSSVVFIVDFPALSLKLQKELADALSERRARRQGGSHAYTIESEIVLHCRNPIDEHDPKVEMALVKRSWPRSLMIPSLGKRPEDVEGYVIEGIELSQRVLPQAPQGIEPAALERLRAYSWPGNLTQLIETVVTLASRAKGELITETEVRLVLGDTFDLDTSLYGNTYENLEQRILREAIRRANGNKSEAARSLGLKRTTFLDKLRRFGLDAETGFQERDESQH